MAYHISNLGGFGGNMWNPDDPAYYATLDGFVPQVGDPKPDPETAREGDWSEFSDEDWTAWLARAEAATARAERRAREWQAAHP